MPAVIGHCWSRMMTIAVMQNERNKMLKTVDEYKEYEVSNDGLVRRKDTKHILKPWIATGGYLYVAFSENCKGHTKRLHRIVAKAFCDNYDGKPHVNHIDGNKTNNVASNLEWCDRSENQVHAFSNGLQTHIGKYPVKSVVCVNDGKVFGTIRQASEHYGICRSAIYACCTRWSKRSKSGLIFRFAERRTE
jgi:hypothetical protein